MQHHASQSKHPALLIACIALAVAAPATFADDQPAPPNVANTKADKDNAKSNEQPSLDDLLKLPTPKRPADAKPDRADAVDVNKLDPQKAADAFAKAVTEMLQAADRLGNRQDAGLATQRIQESVLSRLDQVIAAAKQQQQQQQGKSGSSQKQQRQQTGSSRNTGQKNQPGGKQGKNDQKGTQPNKGSFSPGKATDARPGGPIEEGRIEWGQLPARLRNELEEGLGEKFSPLYRKLTEAYYRRLAEESSK